MVFAFLVVLNASSLCVAHTDVCAPAGSTIDGTIGQSGGTVTITPSKPMRALGAEFRSGTKVTVTVNPWGGSNKTSGAVVHVSGELVREMQLSGARVAGAVRIGQVQGNKSPVQLVQADDFKGGQLKVGTAGTVDVGPGMQVIGGVDIGSVRLDISSTKPIHALGLDLAAGTVRVEQRTTTITIGGTLVRPQEFGGVLVEQQLYATLDGTVPLFGSATLARTTKLRSLGLPDGEAPAGTKVQAVIGSTQLLGAGPVTVCGLPIGPRPTMSGQEGVTFTISAPSHIEVTGTFGAGDVDVGGIHITGPVSLRYGFGGCTQLGLKGSLARATEHLGLHFTAKTPFAIGEFTKGKDSVISGTLAQSAVVDGLTLKGKAAVLVTKAGDLHLADGTLAKAASFENWQVPAGTHVERFDSGWSFTVLRGQRARATSLHRGERVDHVIEARSDDSSTSFELARPHKLRGTTLALDGIGIDHTTGCVVGQLTFAQSLGAFMIPKGGSATLCGGTLIAAEGVYAVPSLRVGAWFATGAFAGDPKSPPTAHGELVGSPPAVSTAVTGYWIQINSLCQGRAGIPLPPPEERWIFVDLKGLARSAADRKELAARAARPGRACPVTPCCPP